ncbi:FkbM family methyltransferase [Pedobacter sp. AW31-3R]|uniref:FkbM family methyltransferase n=1 Tax=Pedobacter sp. AW31-3R TaxID=3445781 RepID=UPI003FA09445
MNKLEAFITLLEKPNRLKALLSYGHKGYLVNIGWFKSFDTHQAVNENGDPLPWVTYSFIDFIGPRLNKEMTIFEYGSGNSTLFYAKRVQHVISVEHDELWYNKIVSSKPENSEMIFCKLEKDGEYSSKAASLHRKFDIIIVDGRDRVNCCKKCISALNPGGIIVLDDSDRKHYAEAFTFLKEAGFKNIPFTGIAPGLFYLKSTTIFYKQENCLQI